MLKRVIIALFLTVAVHSSYAQGCVVCTKTAAGLDKEKAKGLNAGILYLAGLPLVLLGTIGFVWYRSNKNN